MRYLICALLFFGAVCLWASPVKELRLGQAYIDGLANKAGAKTGIRLGDGSLVPYAGEGLSLAAGDARAEFTLSSVSGSESVIAVKASAPGDLAGAGWGVSFSDKGTEVFVPQYSGASYSAGSIEGDWQFGYPQMWEAQFVIIQKKDEGWLIHADDDMEFFKTLYLTHRGGLFSLDFETNTQAPFGDRTSLSSCPWRVVHYRGNWLEGARLYREYADKKFSLSELEKTKPAWTKDIEFVVNDYNSGEDVSLLEDLARELDPGRVLVYFPIWRTKGYDVDYPDYEPSPSAKERIKRVKALGYRVMVHTNYFGVGPRHPLYEELKEYHVKDPFTGNRYTVEVPGQEICYIDPASSKWRKIFIERVKKAVEELQLDALFTDQTLCIFNDGNGIIDGLNMMQGNLQEHKELRAALPGVALAGEGLNEITCRYESFAQRHLLGADYSGGGGGVDPFITSLASSVSSAVFSPYTQAVGYLGVPPLGDEEQMKDYFYTYDRYCVLPTLPLRSKEERDGHRAMYDYIVGQGRLWQQYSPRMCLDPRKWGRESIMVYDTRTGETLELREKNGLRGLWKGDALLSGKATGIRTLKTDRELMGAEGYAGGKYLNLDPQKKYIMGEGAPRKSPVSEKAAVAVRQAGGLLMFEAEPREISLPLHRGVYTGHVMKNGKTVLYRSPSCRTEENAIVEWGKNKIRIHPPFRMTGPAASKGEGKAVIRYKNVLLPSGPSRFEAQACLLNMENQQKSDGVRFTVTADCRGKTLSAERPVFTAAGEPLTLDLTPFAGKRINLEIAVDPGPAGDTSYDFSCLENPRIREEAGEFDFYAPEGDWTFAAAGRKGYMKRDKKGLKVHSSSPRGFLTSREPALFEPGSVDRWYQYQTTPEKLEIVTERRNLTDSRFKVAGAETFLLDSHPPRVGRNIFAVLGTVQGSVREFSVKCAIRDEAVKNSEGVLFAIAVNGEIQNSLKINKEAGWHELAVDLTPWKGKTIFLEIIADSLKDNYFDWAVFSDPVFR
ncbi:MAG: hypothetical protein ILO36_06230 [Abditibacteriota bacterium]|nr:hypothetical protein [Abditibacteriota bacterium]